MSDYRERSDPWAYIDGLREDLGRAEERIHDLEAAQAELKAENEKLWRNLRGLSSRTEGLA